MSRPFLCGLTLALAVAWLPGGLIHRGQQQANSNARPILAIDRCDPLFDWHACRNAWLNHNNKNNRNAQ